MKRLPSKKIIILFVIFLLFIIPVSLAKELLIGEGTEKSPFTWDQGNIGVTNDCKVMIYDAVWDEWNPGGISYLGWGTADDPFKLNQEPKGLQCTPSSYGTPIIKIRYYVNEKWEDELPAVHGVAGAKSGSPQPAVQPSTSILITPANGVTITPSQSYIPTSTTTGLSTCSEIDEVWHRIGFKIGSQHHNEVWNIAWVNYDLACKPQIPTTMPGGLCFPIERTSFKYNANNFGSRREGGTRCHAGIDLYTQGEGKVVAIDNGIYLGSNVFKPDCENGAAWRVMIYHPSIGKTVNYAELNENGLLKLAPGQPVSKGQVIGYANVCQSGGNTMLHLEVYNQQRDSPLQWHPPAGTVLAEIQNVCDISYKDQKPSGLDNPVDFLSTLTFCGENGAAIAFSPSPSFAPPPRVLPQYEGIIQQAATKHTVDANLIKAVMYAENSDFGVNDISSGGCVGLMQICAGSADTEYIQLQCSQKNGPFYCRSSTCAINTNDDNKPKDVYWCEQCLGSDSVGCVTDDRFDINKNIFTGTKVLQKKRFKLNGYCTEEKCVIAAYNVGEGVIQEAARRAGGTATWETIRPRINVALLQTFPGYKNVNPEELQEKINNLPGYVERAYASYQYYQNPTITT